MEKIDTPLNMLALSCGAVLIVSNLIISSPAHSTEKLIAKSVIAKSTTSPLSIFIHKLWQNSPFIQEAKAKVSMAKAQEEASSKWLYNPEVSFDTEKKKGEKRSRIIGISQTIDWSGKFLASGKVAALDLKAMEAEFNIVRQSLAVDVLSTLADYQAAGKVLELSTRRVELMKRFSSLAQKGFKVGDIEQSEYNLAQLAYSDALIKKADAESDLTATRLKLESIIGFSSSNIGIFPVLSATLPRMNNSAKSTDELIMGLPAMQVLKNQEAALEKEISRAELDKIPDPTISLTGGQSEGSRVVGLSVSIPFNVFNGYGAKVDVVKYKAKAKGKSLLAAHHSAKSRFNSSKKDFKLASHAWNVWRKHGSKALAEQINILSKRYEVGDLNATNYLVQIQQTLDTEIAAKNLHAKAWKAWFAYMQASGRIEQWLGD